MAVAFTACQDLDDPIPLAPEISTPDVLEVGTDYVIFDSIKYDGDYDVLCYYVSEYINFPDTSYRAVYNNYNIITGLDHSTTYYYRAAISYGIGEVYGETKTFTTDIAHELSIDEDSDIDEWNGNVESDTTEFETDITAKYLNGYEYVDLGLSVNWATMNVGAESPEDYGSYYSWAEISTKTYYNVDYATTEGVSISEFSGNSKYDVATYRWGSQWRTPTYEEVSELIETCTWTWTTQDEVYGYMVTGTNGSSIFLPAAGYMAGEKRFYAKTNGYYWSSTPYIPSTYNYYYAYAFEFTSDTIEIEYERRLHGYSVRPVFNY